MVPSRCWVDGFGFLDVLLFLKIGRGNRAGQVGGKGIVFFLYKLLILDAKVLRIDFLFDLKVIKKEVGEMVTLREILIIFKGILVHVSLK